MKLIKTLQISVLARIAFRNTNTQMCSIIQMKDAINYAADNWKTTNALTKVNTCIYSCEELRTDTILTKSVLSWNSTDESVI